MKKRVYIAYTGGTIGMIPTPHGYAPTPEALPTQLAAMPELSAPQMPEFTVNTYAPLLDSSDMTPADWGRIAADIGAHYADYDGFVILHGTDTMAYTASALAFMLQGLRKPVILTGAQIPLCELRSDGRGNLITALLLAAHYPIPEVCLCMGQTLLRGCRAVKLSASDFDAFASPNLLPLGEIGVDLCLHWERILPPPPPETPFRVQAFGDVSVGALRLWPGISSAVVRNLLQPPLCGLVLEAYGVGNAPTGHPDFLAALAEAVQRGVVIVDCTQCLTGSVNLAGYATGSALARIGVLSGFDMTVEAALSKLTYLLSQALPLETVKYLMLQNLRGELTLPAETHSALH